MRLTVGIVMVLGGALLFLSSRLERSHVPSWLPRLALGIVSLGLSTLAILKPGLSWSISSISFSLVAIVLIAWVISDILRRR